MAVLCIYLLVRDAVADTCSTGPSPLSPPDMYFSRFLCGYSSGVNYMTTSDARLAMTYPISALMGSVSADYGGVLAFAMSVYNCAQEYGTAHGGIAAKRVVSLDLPRAQTSDPSMRIVQFTACCADDDSFSMYSVQNVRFRTANGTELGIGAEFCRHPQPWVRMPEGYTFAGLVTQFPEDRANGPDWIHRLAFIAVRGEQLPDCSSQQGQGG
ncbi:hypothetical protein PLESTB_000598800 [Pleodorina starrii]|uniref:Uncharacterized protein n=1 Tax=Pleodorina starrii TaxID=330485 RepID=A0A9W6BHI8_9CHLO|nr:hypothetical protein PLESTB_000598800 [Pleodorina starrii]GLC67585.1 hypothetical protein PLESTF_000576900 [Pleodorina starrii]